MSVPPVRIDRVFVLVEAWLRALVRDEIRAAFAEVHVHPVDEWLDSTRTAEVLGLHVKHVNRLARGGKLRGSKLGNAWRFSRSDVDAFVKGRSNGQANP